MVKIDVTGDGLVSKTDFKIYMLKMEEFGVPWWYR